MAGTESAARAYPFPIPFGWFCVAHPDDVAPGAAVARYYFGRHLVVWRDHQGVPHVQDAFCPHLGAHLGHGGTVEPSPDGTDCITCPFHGWQFDAEGTNADIPYSERVNRKARLHTYPAVERNGLIMAWYHPEGVEPMWEVPVVPAFDGEDTEYSTMIATHHVIDACWQEMAENGVDSAHFRYVHNTAEVPQLEEYVTGFPESSMRSSQKFPTPRGVMEGRIDSTSCGPGMSVVSFSGIIDTLNLAAQTPIDAGRVELWFHFRFKTMGDEETTRNVGNAFVREVDKQVQEDKPIWEHKAHLVRPALAAEDGPFVKFRKWAAQFYAEDVVADRDVYEPPFWPDRIDDAPAKATASARYTTP
jgi:phenylpropionate dioxygenase-like ring-hydroxylating dioxygenase large terminal subunit